MGVAVSRKAILGGKCVETGEDLGEPITHMVDTFVGVGGVAFGYQDCPTMYAACNLINGMNCGSTYMVSILKITVLRTKIY